MNDQIDQDGLKLNIRALSGAETTDALPLVWEVFSQYEAPQYTESGKQVFWDAIHDEGYLDQLRAYGVFDGDTLVGIIATRSEGQHLALFFVKSQYHGQGIGRALWDHVLSESAAQTITIHSSHYAVPIYEKLGFVRTGATQVENGIAYIPMECRISWK